MTTTHSPVAGASGAPAVELRSLVKTFPPAAGRTTREVRAVDGVDLRIEPGEVVAFLGPNGAGKTTTLDMVLGLTEPTTGTARVFGRRPREAVIAGHVSAVLQTGGLLRDLTVRETVRMIASTYAASTPVDEVIDRAGLRALADRRVSKCSGGEQQRLRFALALLPDPRLLVLDEPTAGMDVDGPPRLLGHDARRRERGPHRRLRDALPRGGRRLRRPHRPHRRWPHRRGRHDGRDPVPRERPHRLGDPAVEARSPRPSRDCARSTASATSRSAAPGSSSRPPTPTRWRGCCCSTSAAPTSRSSPPASSRPS